MSQARRPVTPPPACPDCGKPSRDIVALPGRRGFHCHGQDTDRWRASCQLLRCPCGCVYGTRGHYNEKKAKSA